MFDIEEYFKYGENESCTILDGNSETLDEIESNISEDIDSIVSNENSNLYNCDKLRQNKYSIDILYPKMEYPWNRSLMKGPDYIRFMLSIYPFEEDLRKISKIVLRPRHIEIGDIELMGIYLPEKKIYVQYLYYPHSYAYSNTRLKESDHFMPFNISTMHDSNKLGKTPPDESGKTIPPLLYAISTISQRSSNDIDKFFVKINPAADRKILQTLDEISYHYSRYGY